MKSCSLLIVGLAVSYLNAGAQSYDRNAIPEEIIPPGAVVTNKVIPRGALGNPISGPKNEGFNVGGTATDRPGITSGRGSSAGSPGTNTVSRTSVLVTNSLDAGRINAVSQMKSDLKTSGSATNQAVLEAGKGRTASTP